MNQRLQIQNGVINQGYSSNREVRNKAKDDAKHRTKKIEEISDIFWEFGDIQHEATSQHLEMLARLHDELVHE